MKCSAIDGQSCYLVSTMQIEMFSLFDVTEVSGSATAAPPPEAPIVAEQALVASVQTAAAPETFAEAIRIVLAGPASKQGASKASALKRMCEIVGRTPSDLPTNPVALRDLLRQVDPIGAGVKEARWRSIRSIAFRALKDMGVDVLPSRSPNGLGDDWSALMARAPQKIQLRLSRFSHFADAKGILPGAVSPAVFEEFRTELVTRSLKAAPEAIVRASIKGWNNAAAVVEGWPNCAIPLERHERFYSLDWTRFPSTFAEDVEAFLSAKEKPDLLADDYFRAVRPSTIDVRRGQVRRMASGLADSGYPIDQITGLDTLVEPDNAKRALRFMLDRHDGKSSSSIQGYAYLLVTIARHWTKRPDVVPKLEVLAKNLAIKKGGMVQRNVERLRQFDDKNNVSALLHLPRTVFHSLPFTDKLEAENGRLAMMALAVELLIVAPMRISNLVGLELHRHIITTGRGKGRCTRIFIPAEEAKNDTDFDVLLPLETAGLLDRYVTQFRSAIWPGPSDFLFPGRTGGRRSTESFSTALSAFVEKRAAVTMNAHLFRSLAGKLHLEANPHDVETVRRVLNHRSSATTLRAYVHQQTDKAFERYDETIRQLRQGELGGAVEGGDQ